MSTKLDAVIKTSYDMYVEEKERFFDKLAEFIDENRDEVTVSDRYMFVLREVDRCRKNGRFYYTYSLGIDKYNWKKQFEVSCIASDIINIITLKYGATVSTQTIGDNVNVATISLSFVDFYRKNYSLSAKLDAVIKTSYDMYIEEKERFFDKLAEFIDENRDEVTFSDHYMFVLREVDRCRKNGRFYYTYSLGIDKCNWKKQFEVSISGYMIGEILKEEYRVQVEVRKGENFVRLILPFVSVYNENH